MTDKRSPLFSDAFYAGGQEKGGADYASPVLLLLID